MTTTFPSDRHDKSFKREGKGYFIVAGILLATLFITVKTKSCAENNYDITTSARAFAPPSDWKTNPIPAVYVDTPAPVKTYWYVMRVEPQVWNTTVDTLNLVLNQIGKAKTVDEADAIRNIAYRVLGRLGSRITLDSTINKHKK